MKDQTEVPSSGAGCLVRMFWLFAGNALLFFLLVFIYEKHPKFPSLLDAAYLLTVAALIIVRYVDIRFLKGETGEGKPATIGHWRRYAMAVGPVGVGVWLGVRLLTHLFK